MKTAYEDLAEMQDFTIKQTGFILQLSEPTIWRLCKKGILEKYKIGNSTRITRRSVEKVRNNDA